MRAAWWWIDRWRQSRAYTDMTAEEQGLYRNLCDEVWLRDEHVIPDDPRILARVSGDPEAWARCSEKVLGWMKRVTGGWTNETAMEVIEQSKRRADNQKRYRLNRNNAPVNKLDNTSDSPSPSPSPSPCSSGQTVGPANPLLNRTVCDREALNLTAKIAEAEDRDGTEVAIEASSYTRNGQVVPGRPRYDTLSDDRLAHTLRWLRDRWRQIEEKRASKPAGELPLDRIKRIERERAERLTAKAKA